VFALAAELNIN